MLAVFLKDGCFFAFIKYLLIFFSMLDNRTRGKKETKRLKPRYAIPTSRLLMRLVKPGHRRGSQKLKADRARDTSISSSSASSGGASSTVFSMAGSGGNDSGDEGSSESDPSFSSSSSSSSDSSPAVSDDEPDPTDTESNDRQHDPNCTNGCNGLHQFEYFARM